MSTTHTVVPTEVSASTPALSLSGVTKSFGPIHAVKSVSLEIARHEVVGLIGENGAGKSTLLKLLTGVYEPDSGTIQVHGKTVKFRTPLDAAIAGIGVVHQEQSLVANLSVAENIELSALPSKGRATRFGIWRWRQLNRQAAQTLQKVGSSIDPRATISDLTFVDRQMVEIARAMHVDESVHSAPVVILDEPTSLLERNESEILEREITKLKELGSVIFVSHRLDEVMRICDRIIVMRHGEVVADRLTASVTEADLFKLMVGRESYAVDRTATSRTEKSATVLEISELNRAGAYRDVSLTVAPGTITAIIGTVGSGRESLCRAIFGAEAFDSGSVKIDGREVRSWSVYAAVRNGVGYVPSERRVEGIISGLSSAENLTLTHPGLSRVGPLLRRRTQVAIATEWFEKLDVRPRDPQLSIERFSGGNQQKVVMAKWLLSDNLKILILDHPLRGLDPGAAETVNGQIRAARDAGTAVILLADTLEEALEMGDDILVMRDGEITARFDLSSESPSSLNLLEKMV